MKDAFRNPAHPERVCWGCDKLCPAESLGCANGSIRTPHPKELFGDDWEAFFAEKEGTRDRPCMVRLPRSEPTL